MTRSITFSGRYTLEGYALALDGSKVYTEALCNVLDAARELRWALPPEQARRYALLRAVDLRMLEIDRAGRTGAMDAKGASRMGMLGTHLVQATIQNLYTEQVPVTTKDPFKISRH